MPNNAVTYTVILVAMIAGVAALLAGEFFHGVEFLVPAGGALALVAVGGLTFAISRAEAPEGGGH